MIRLFVVRSEHGTTLKDLKMFDELKAHLEEMLRGFRSGVAVAEEHIVEALVKLERSAAQLIAPAAPPAEATNPPVPSEPAAATTGEAATGEAQNGGAPEELAATVTTAAPPAEAGQPTAEDPQTATVTTDPQPAAAA